MMMMEDKQLLLEHDQAIWNVIFTDVIECITPPNWFADPTNKAAQSFPASALLTDHIWIW